MNHYEIIQERLINKPQKWLITGVAGFIGSNLLEKLLKMNQQVIGLDNFLTGHMRNIEEVQASVSSVSGRDKLSQKWSLESEPL